MSATGLKSADRNGKSDPFVKLMLAGQRAKSKTIMMTLDPQWDEHFEFAGIRGELVRQLLCSPMELFRLRLNPRCNVLSMCIHADILHPYCTTLCIFS